jgi:chromosome segregation ATPase
MVQADISQLSGECNTWRESLRTFRDEINHFKPRLQHVANKNLSKEQLKDVEHYHNQFHIQLINIHDLKQSIKAHDRRVKFEMSANNGQINDDTLAEHEHLFEEYQALDQTLQDLRKDFNSFLSLAS